MPEPESERAAATCTVQMHDGAPCGREPYANEDKCICHSERVDRDPSAFWREIEAMLARKDYDFTRFVFPDDATFVPGVFDEPVRFWGATFQGEAQFPGATFKKEANFGTTTFCGRAHFPGATFDSGVDFADAKFVGDAHFDGASFEGRSDFTRVQFGERAYFTWADFREDTLFQEATFRAYAGFLGATFRRCAHLSGATFQGEAEFRRAAFHGDASFLYASFQGPVRFGTAIFTAGRRFAGARFMGGVDFCIAKMHDGEPCGRQVHDGDGSCICHSNERDKDPMLFQREIGDMLARNDYDFSRFVFPGSAEFAGTRFDGPVWFTETAIRGQAVFFGATFERGASFSRVLIEGGADFSGTTFQGWVSFLHGTFQGAASFDFARVQGNATFWGVTFHHETSFYAATFQGEAEFAGSADNRVFSAKAAADFRLARFTDPAKAVFHHVYLGMTRFLGADVRRVDFTKVEWATRSDGRPAVWDELRSEEDGEEKDYALIAKLYRQLKYNYEEEQRDPIRAGDFHFGEMEMRRLEKPPKNAFVRFLKRYLSAIAFYRWISGYGEDYIQALACSVGVILAFAVVFAYIPVFALEPGASSTASHSMQGLGSRLVYSVMCFLLRGDQPLRPVCPPGYYWSVAEGVIGPPLIAMFVLALNRRFKR
jgi:uncharacterized protein YjbI with pentapeptide repeats